MFSRASRWIGAAIVAALLLAPAAASAKDTRSPKATIAAALKLILDGKHDAFIKTLCHPDACSTPAAIKSIKHYNLPATERRAKPCLKEGDDVDVVKTQGDPAVDKEIKVFINCGEKRMPPPATLRKDGGDWKIYRFSW